VIARRLTPSKAAGHTSWLLWTRCWGLTD
jgi:hypothetical protein